ncbi:MAG: lysine--tRNA ligase [Candidatus Aenigmarchaeota archaeon]|nr:lysine--tRNA ligase [Candidatus Aenigmarchaeota archaeon]
MSNEEHRDFWPFGIAKELISGWEAERHVITTGVSMSGDPHIGNANDVIRGDAIRLALEKLGAKAELVWISDDMDPFRSVPAGMPQEMEDYLGVPAALIPDFWDDGHKDFIEHFEEKFLRQLAEVGVKPTVKRGIDMYRAGEYNESIKVAMGKRGEVAEILNKFKQVKLGEGWYPINVICEKCSKISTTVIKGYDEESCEAEYFCNDETVLLQRKNPVRGCGHSGKVSVLDGHAKITWRVEWPARWSFLGTTCEPFGKEHSSAGGSWDTGKEIAEKVFGYKAPHPVVYEHFLVNGEKMSKSKGNVITVDDMLRYMLPQHLRYWMFQGRLTIAKNIVLKDISPRVFDEFDRAELAYFDPESVEDERERNNLASAYELSMSGKIPTEMVHIPFAEMKSLVESGEKIKTGGGIAEKKVEIVRNWVRDFEPKKEEAKLEVEIGDAERRVLRDLIEVIESEKGGDELQTGIFEVAKRNGMRPADFFRLVYGVLLGSDKGPRLGPYIAETGKAKVIGKLKNAI